MTQFHPLLPPGWYGRATEEWVKKDSNTLAKIRPRAAGFYFKICFLTTTTTNPFCSGTIEQKQNIQPQPAPRSHYNIGDIKPNYFNI